MAGASMAVSSVAPGRKASASTTASAPAPALPAAESARFHAVLPGCCGAGRAFRLLINFQNLRCDELMATRLKLRPRTNNGLGKVAVMLSRNPLSIGAILKSSIPNSWDVEVITRGVWRADICRNRPSGACGPRQAGGRGLRRHRGCAVRSGSSNRRRSAADCRAPLLSSPGSGAIRRAHHPARRCWQ